MSGRFKTFRDLECWQACRTLRLFVFKEIVPLLPVAEKHRLTDQLIRAARSTTANVAEAYGRYHYLDNAKFCCNARGSAYETLDHLVTAFDEGLITADLFSKGEQLVEQAVKRLNGYITYLQRAGNREQSKDLFVIEQKNADDPSSSPLQEPISNSQ